MWETISIYDHRTHKRRPLPAPAPPTAHRSEQNGEVAFEGGWWTPLGLACRLGQLDVVRLLLSKGADLEQPCSGLATQDTR